MHQWRLLMGETELEGTPQPLTGAWSVGPDWDY